MPAARSFIKTCEKLHIVNIKTREKLHIIKKLVKSFNIINKKNSWKCWCQKFSWKTLRCKCCDVSQKKLWKNFAFKRKTDEFFKIALFSKDRQNNLSIVIHVKKFLYFHFGNSSCIPALCKYLPLVKSKCRIPFRIEIMKIWK